MQDIKSIIEALHLKDLENKIHSSVFDENDIYNMFIIRIPVLTDQSVDVRQIGFIIKDNHSYYYNQDEHSFKFLDETFTIMHKMVNQLVNTLLKRFTVYQDQVSDMEDNLYNESHHPDFMTQWLGLKRDTLYIERVLSRSVMSLEGLSAFYKENENFPLNHYQDLHEHMQRVLRSATFQLAKLDYIYNFYNVRTNEKMNRMMYLLTVISGVFLPLNLAVGFFGMNTSGLPFTTGTLGTWSAVSLMGTFLIVTVGLFAFLKRNHIK